MLSRNGTICLRTKLCTNDTEHEGRPSTTTDSKIAACTNESILANRHITIVKISIEVGFSHGNVHKIADQLIIHKVCSRGAPFNNEGI